MSKKPGTSSSATRTLRVLIALKGYTMTGLSNGELAKALNVSPANISRDLATLVDVGLVIQLDNGRYAHSIKCCRSPRLTPSTCPACRPA